MSARARSGVVQICIQMGWDGTSNSSLALKGVNGTCEEVARTIHELSLPVTWAVSPRHIEWSASAAGCDRIRTDVCMLTESSWCSPTISRGVFLAGLRSRLDLLRSSGSNVSTLVMHDAYVERFMDAMPREGIQVVRRPIPHHARGTVRSHPTPRFGMMVIQPSAVFPDRPGSLVCWDRAYAVKRSLWKVICQRQMQHVVVDLDRLSGLSKSPLRQLTRWLRMVARLEAAGRLEIELLRDSARRMVPSQGTVSARSILRAAA